MERRWLDIPGRFAKRDASGARWWRVGC